MESDSILTYQLHGVIREAIENLNDIKEEDVESDVFPTNIKMVSETTESDDFLSANTMVIKAQATNVSLNRLKQLNKMSEEDRQEAEKYVVKVNENFKLNSVAQGKQKLARVKSTLIAAIIRNIEQRFNSIIDSGGIYKAFIVFDANLWVDGEETDQLMERDQNLLVQIAQRFQVPLEHHNFEINNAKKEWKKVCYTFIITYPSGQNN